MAHLRLLLQLLALIRATHAITFAIDEDTQTTQHCTGLYSPSNNIQSHISIRFDAAPNHRDSIVSLAIFERSDEFVGGVELHGEKRYFCTNETASAGLCQPQDIGSFIGRNDLAKHPLIVTAVHLLTPSEVIYPITSTGEYCVDIYGYNVISFHAHLDFHSPWGSLDASNFHKLSFHYATLVFSLLLLGWSLLLLPGPSTAVPLMTILRITSDAIFVAVGTHVNLSSPGFMKGTPPFLVALPAALWDAAIAHAVIKKAVKGTPSDNKGGRYTLADKTIPLAIPAIQFVTALFATPSLRFTDGKSAPSTLLRGAPALVTLVLYHVFVLSRGYRRPFVVMVALGSLLVLAVQVALLLSWSVGGAADDGENWLARTWRVRWLLVDEARSVLSLVDWAGLALLRW